MDDGSETITVADMKKFTTDCFLAIGVSKAHSEIMAESIVGADLEGHRSHGVFRLDKFVADGFSGDLDVHAEPRVVKETCATAWVDGKNGLGAVVGQFCMKVGIQKAKEIGAAIVVANNSNNFGVANYYSKQALSEGLLAFAVTNSSPLMLPNRAKEPIAGTNPISLAAPGLFGDYFLLDMATTLVSGGNVEIKYKNGEYLPIGMAVNAACLPETNGDVALKTGRFLPLGSFEELGNYKGSGLSLMVDILCGVLGGAHYSHMVGVWLGRLSKQKANVGHCFIIIDPKCFAPDFEVRLSEFMSDIRNLKTDNPNDTIHIPGDKGRAMEKSIEETGGIWYPKYVIESLKKLSIQLKMKCVPFIPKVKRIKVSLSDQISLSVGTEKGGTVVEQEVVSIEEDKAVSDISMTNKDESFIIEDSSDWLCPFTDGERKISYYRQQEKTKDYLFQDSYPELMENEGYAEFPKSEVGTLSEQETLKSELHDEANETTENDESEKQTGPLSKNPSDFEAQLEIHSRIPQPNQMEDSGSER